MLHLPSFDLVNVILEPGAWEPLFLLEYLLLRHVGHRHRVAFSEASFCLDLVSSIDT